METVGIAVKFGKENLRFHQKLISLAEETRLRQKLFGLTEAEKELKAFETAVNSLVEFQAEQMERITFDEKGAETVERMDVRDYFSGDRTATKERIADFTLRGMLLALSPEVSFL